jgi:hypothetical protein
MRLRILVVAACAALVAIAVTSAGFAAGPNKTVVVYDDFSSANNSKWNNQ